MKKIAALLAAAAVLLLASSCDTTVTQEPRNHQYRLGEAISINDDRSGGTRGVLTITGAAVLSNEVFELSEEEDEEGQTQGKAVTYRQIVQIYYTFSNNDGNAKRITRANFIVWDQGGEISNRLSSSDSTPAYHEIPRAGESSFVVALQNPSGYVDINFRYSIWQARPTARIRIDVPGGVAATAPPTVATTPAQPPAPPATTALETHTRTQTEPLPLVPVQVATVLERSRVGDNTILGIGIGVAGVCVLAAAVIAVNAKKRKG